MPLLSFTKRLRIAAVGYGVVMIFAVTFGVLWRITGLSSAERMVLSAAAIAPILLALLWERLKGFKVGDIVEITLSEITLPIDIQISSAIQDMQTIAASEVVDLVQIIGSALDSESPKLVEVNLRDGSYWWSTRLHLLAALADEYTTIDRLVFLEQNDERKYLGMTSPSAVRKALSGQFPVIERAFREIQRKAREESGEPTDHHVSCIGLIWSEYSKFAGSDEEAVKEIVTHAKLSAWLAGQLETESRQWDGGAVTLELCSKILSCKGPFVPLLHLNRLEHVIDQNKLNARLASSVIG